MAALSSREDWRRFLDFQARFHQHSPNNVMLIHAQHAQAFADGLVPTPEPGFVAGFNTWKALGRSVVRGQHGYAVLAPMVGQNRMAVNEDGRERRLGPSDAVGVGEVEERRKTLRGFRLEHVFEVGQTSGANLPEPVLPRLQNDEALHVWVWR